MRLLSGVVAAAILSASAVAFQPSLQNRLLRSNNVAVSTSHLSSTAESESSAPCAMPDVIPESVTARDLRSAILTNADGELVNLGEKMGNGKSIVVFLRHLG